MTTQQDDTSTSTAGRTWGGFVFLAIALLVIGLDLSIADVTLPSIVTDLGIDADSATLIITIFMVVAASFMVLMGKVADLIGPKKSLLLGCVVFAIGSTITGLANSFPTLMAGRAIQGFVLAMAIPASLSLLNQSFPSGRNRALAFSIWTAVIGARSAHWWRTVDLHVMAVGLSDQCAHHGGGLPGLALSRAGDSRAKTQGQVRCAGFGTAGAGLGLGGLRTAGGRKSWLVVSYWRHLAGWNR